MGLVRNAINFIVSFHGLLNHIFNCNYLDTHILSYDEIANRVERAYLSSLLIGNGDTEAGLKKLKETLKDLANPKKINSRINNIEPLLLTCFYQFL